MAIDMEQFKATYIEESLEGLDVMESNLLELQPGSEDMDAINTIFRAAHSIKGGGATFGFSEISQFTHVVETLLDQVRNKEREVTRDSIDLLLESVDCLREMMDAASQGDIGQSERANSIKEKLDALLVIDGAGEKASETVGQNNSVESGGGAWNIYFKPHYDMLRTGNDAVRMFRELETLSDLEVVVNTAELPVYDELDSEACYLSWQIRLNGDVAEADIREVFSWVEDECELRIERETESQTKKKSSKKASKKTTGDSKKSVANVSKAANDVAKPSSSDSKVTESAVQKKVADRKPSSETSSIRVAIEKVDDLITLTKVGKGA